MCFKSVMFNIRLTNFSQKILEKSSLVCMNGEGSTVVAAGFENGDIELWGGKQR